MAHGNARWKLAFIPYYMVAPARWLSPSTDEAIGALKQMGYDGVEWMFGQHFRTAEEMEALVIETRRKGLAVSNIMCWQDLVRSNKAELDRCVSLLRDMIVSAEAVSVSQVNIFTGPVSWNRDAERVGSTISEGAAWSSLVASMSTLLSTAEEHGVILTVEPVFGMLVHDYYTARELLRNFESESLAINIDPSHLALYGNDPAWAVRQLKNRVRHVHVKDVFGRPGEFGRTFHFPFLGEGIVDWRDFFGALREIDYRGFLSLEFENDIYLNNVCNGDWTKAALDLRARVLRFLRDRPTPERAER